VTRAQKILHINKYKNYPSKKTSSNHFLTAGAFGTVLSCLEVNGVLIGFFNVETLQPPLLVSTQTALSATNKVAELFVLTTNKHSECY
jgi:hypothetical protein